MARLLRALGLNRATSAKDKQKEAFDSGNVSDTDVEISCHALKRPASGMRKKMSIDSQNISINKWGSKSKNSTPVHSGIGNESGRILTSQSYNQKASPQRHSVSVVSNANDVHVAEQLSVVMPVPVPLPLDSDYSLPADWCKVAEEQSAYSYADANIDAIEPSTPAQESIVIAPPQSPALAQVPIAVSASNVPESGWNYRDEMQKQQQLSQVYDAPWSCLDHAMLEQIVDSLKAERSQQRPLHIAVTSPENDTEVAADNDNERLSLRSTNSGDQQSAQRYSMISKGRVTLERSEQSAFLPVSKRCSMVNPAVDCSSAASTLSGFHTTATTTSTNTTTSASTSACSPGQYGVSTGAIKCNDSCSSSSECRHGQVNNNNYSNNNNNAMSDCVCAECCVELVNRDGDGDRCDSSLRLSDQDATGENENENSFPSEPDKSVCAVERMLPRMGISSIKSRGAITTSVSSGFAPQVPAPVNRVPVQQRTSVSNAALPNSTSCYAYSRPLTQFDASNDIVWQKQNEGLLSPRRRYSHLATDSNNAAMPAPAPMKQASVNAAEGPYDCPWDDRRARIDALLIHNAGVDLTGLRSANGGKNATQDLPEATNQPQKAAVSQEIERRVDESVVDSRRLATKSSHYRQRSVDCGGTPASRPVQPQPHASSESPVPVSKQSRRQFKEKQQRSLTNRHEQVQVIIEPLPVSSASSKAQNDEICLQPQPLPLPLPLPPSQSSISPLALYDRSQHASVAMNVEVAETIDFSLALEQQGWFYPKMTRKVAETLIEGEVEGSFLVRQCETCPYDYSLTIRNRHAQRGVVHMRISRSSRGYILGGYSQPYESVPVLVHHFMFHALPIIGVPSQVLVHPIVHPALKLSLTSSTSSCANTASSTS